MKLPNRRPKSFEAPAPAQPAIGPLERLREWHGMAEGAHSANTLRAQKADGAIFQRFCEERGESFLPADPKTIRAFIEHEVTAGKKPATVRRYIATIGRAHVGAGLLNPCSGEAVRFKEDGPGDLGPAGAGAGLGLEGDQGIYWERGKGAPSGSRARYALRRL